MPRPHRSDPSSWVHNRSAAMPILTYFAVIGSVLVALLFVVGPTLESGTRAVVTSDRVGLPKPWHPDSIKTLVAAPAPAPDMTSPLALLPRRRHSPHPKFWRRSSLRPVRRGKRRHPRRSVSPAGKRRMTTGRTAPGRKIVMPVRSAAAHSSAATEHG